MSKNGLNKLWWLFFPLLLFPSCVTMEQDILRLNDQATTLTARVTKLEESVSNNIDSRLALIRERQAEIGDEIDKMRQEIQVLSGRVEDNYHLVKRSVERDTTEQDAMQATMSDLGRRVAETEIRLKHIHKYLGLEPPDRLREPDSKKDPLETKGPAPQPGVLEKKPESPKGPTSPEDQAYELTLATYRDGQYEKAIAGFKVFLKEYPGSDLADNAQFWVGECYMALKQYEQAILAYQEVIKKYPKGNKVPNAMLRQALAFYEIKDKISSRLLLKKIIKKHPNSSEAKIAKAKLKTIK